VTAWKSQLLESAAGIFGGDAPAADSKERIRELHAKIPGGHLNFPHPWPGQIPPAEAAGRRDGYTLSARFATRAAASFSRQLLPSNLSRCA
jgi:hypothetical protein